MKFQLSLWIAVLCYACPLFSMPDCDCTWDIDIVNIETESGDMITLPNACWARCLGYKDAEFLNFQIDINEDPTCACSLLPDPVVLEDYTGAFTLFKNECAAACAGYVPEEGKSVHFYVPLYVGQDCSMVVDEVFAKTTAGSVIPLPNQCWAEAMGFKVMQDTPELSDETKASASTHPMLIAQDRSATLAPRRNQILEKIQWSDLSTQKGNNAEATLGKMIASVAILPLGGKSEVFLKLDMNAEIGMRLDILSKDGKLYRSVRQQVVNGKNVVALDIQDLASGEYFLEVFAGKENQRLNFAKS